MWKLETFANFPSACALARHLSLGWFIMLEENCSRVEGVWVSLVADGTSRDSTDKFLAACSPASDLWRWPDNMFLVGHHFPFYLADGNIIIWDMKVGHDSQKKYESERVVSLATFMSGACRPQAPTWRRNRDTRSTALPGWSCLWRFLRTPPPKYFPVVAVKWSPLWATGKEISAAIVRTQKTIGRVKSLSSGTKNRIEAIFDPWPGRQVWRSTYAPSDVDVTAVLLGG